MATKTTKNLFKRGRYYYVRQRLPNGKLHVVSTGETTLAKAREKRDELLAPTRVKSEVRQLKRIEAEIAGREAELGAFASANRLKIRDAWIQYVRSPNRPDSGEGTLRNYNAHFKRFNVWVDNNYKYVIYMSDVTQVVAEAYAMDLQASGSSPNTYNKHINFLALMFRVLAKPARMEKNPFKAIRRKRLKTHSRRELTIEELCKVLERASGEMQTLFAIGIFTGLRLGDCATLRWHECDLVRGVICRLPNKTASRHPERKVRVGIPVTLAEILLQIPERERHDYVLPEIAELYNRAAGELTDKIQKHFKACGIAVHKSGTGFEERSDPKNPGKMLRVHTGKRAVVEVGFHSLRHTYVSLHAESGTPQMVVQQLVGHGSPAMTAHYTHLSEQGALQAAENFPALLQLTEENRSGPASKIEQARTILEAMDGHNWSDCKNRLLEMLKQ